MDLQYKEFNKLLLQEKKEILKECFKKEEKYKKLENDFYDKEIENDNLKTYIIFLQLQ